MLQSLRNQSNNWLIYLLFGIIIVVFVFMFGLPSTDSCAVKPATVAAQVNGHKIMDDDLRAAIIRASGDNDSNARDFSITQRVTLNNMIITLLLADRAKAMDLRVSNEELMEYLTNWERGNPDIYNYLRGNRFEQNAYENFVAYTGMSPDRYEDYKRDELLAKPYLEFLESSITASDFEVKHRFNLTYDYANVRYADISPLYVSRIVDEPTDADIDAYIANSGEKVKQFYTDNIAKYTKPEQVRVREIVIQKNLAKLTKPGKKTNKSLNSGQRFAVAKKALFDDKQDFADVMADYDESLIKRESGDRGLIAIKDLSGEYVEALKDKNINDTFIVENAETYIIAQLLGREAEVVTPLEDTQKAIAKSLLGDERTDAMIATKSQELYDAVAGGEDFEKALDRIFYTNIRKEEPTTEKDGVVPPDAEIELELDADGFPIYNEDGTPKVKTVEKVIPAEVLAQKVIPGYLRIQVLESDDFNINDMRIPGIGDNIEMLRDIRKTEAGKILSKVYQSGRNRMVVVLISKTPPTAEKFEEVKDTLRQNIREYKIMSMLGQWRALFGGNSRQLFVIQTAGYGPWIQALLDDAKNSGKVRINSKYANESAPILSNQ